LDTKGQHLLVEYYGRQKGILDDVRRVETLLKQAATAAGASVVQSVFHKFAPQGVSGVVVIEESHLSVHTWPESGYAAVDFYTCGDCFPERAHQTLMDGLCPSKAEIMLVERGLQGRRSMQVQDHRVDINEAGANDDPASSASTVSLRNS